MKALTKNFPRGAVKKQGVIDVPIVIEHFNYYLLTPTLYLAGLK